MSVGIIVLIILGSLLIDVIVFFALIRPRMLRAKFVAFLQERSFEVEYDSGEVKSARGVWDGVPCEVRFNDHAEPRSSFRMELPSTFPADARVRFHPGEKGLFADDALDHALVRLRKGELLEIESTSAETVFAIFSAPDVLPPLLKLLRFQPEWTLVEGGLLRYELPILARRKNFVTWIFDQMLPVARELSTASRHPVRVAHAAAQSTPFEGPSASTEAAMEEHIAPSPSPPPSATAPTPCAEGAQALLVTVERTETTMGFDLPEALQWGVTLLGTDAGGRRVRVLFARGQADTVRNLETGAQREFSVQPAPTPSSDDRINFYNL